MLAWTRLVPEDGGTPNGVRFGVSVPSVPDELSHLPPMLAELGTVAESASGAAPLSFTEIDAWARLCAFRPSAFEARALHLMSAAYAAIARDREAECPVQDGEAQQSIDEVNIAAWRAFGASRNG